MTRRSPLLAAALISAVLSLGVFLIAGGSAHVQVPIAPSPSGSVGAKDVALGSGPMAFEPTGDGRFTTRGKGYAVAVDGRGPTMAIGRSALSLRLEGGRSVAAAPSRRQRLVVNRYTGHSARTGIPTFGQVTYRGVLPGIDLRYHGRAGQLEYDFALRPHADAGSIALRVNGARSLRLARNGDLLMETRDGTLRQHKPVAFQDGKRVAAAFVVDGTRFGFRLGRHDATRPILIDPHLSFADYIGGDGNFDSARRVAVDSSGNIYVVGATNSSSIPGGTGSTHGNYDAWVARLAPDGSRQWVTYLGGSGIDAGLDIALDGAGRPYVVGFTKSTNFPTTSGLQTGLANGAGDEDGFVTALSTTGSIRYSTYAGYAATLDSSPGLAVTPSGYVYLALSSGTTEPAAGTSLPPVQPVPTNGYMLVFNPNLTYATGMSFGGSGGDSVNSVGLAPGCDASNCVAYAAGHTVSGGHYVAYVLKWNFQTATSPWGTFKTYNVPDSLGNPVTGEEDVAALAMDPNGNPTVMGTIFTSSTDNYAFVARYRASDGATETPGFTYESSKVGGVSSASDITYDAQGNLYALATTSGTTGVKTDAVQAENGGAYDGILLKYAPGLFSGGQNLNGHFVWQSFVGGSAAEIAMGVATDSHGGSYVVGESGSGGWLASPVSQAKSTGDDGFIWAIRTNAATITDGPSGTVATRDVTFKYTTGETDGSITCRLVGPGSSPDFGPCGTGPSGSKSFTGLSEGDYSFEIRTTDSGGTSNGETTTRAFKVDTAPHAVFTIAPNPSLVGRVVSFDASGSTAATPITKYEWDLDGNGSFEADGGTVKTISMVYPTVGTFNVGLRITDSDGHQATATVPLTITSGAGVTGQNGVTINNGAQFTNDPDVTVTATFPSFVTNLLFSNDGGFGKAQTFPAKKETPWKLDSSGPERLPKTIYVRFLTGSFSGETHQDDIILDETPPVLAAAQVTPVGAGSSGAASAARLRRYTIKTKASDKTSGVGKIQATANKKKPGKALKYKKKVTVKAAKRPVWVRVRDRAGNWSKWKRSR